MQQVGGTTGTEEAGIETAKAETFACPENVGVLYDRSDIYQYHHVCLMLRENLQAKSRYCEINPR